MDKKKLLKEFEEDFEKLRKELKFKISLKELEDFSVSDSILSAGFVPEKLDSFILGRIIEYYRDWHGYLNSLLLPNPSSYANQTEAKLFNNEEDKKKIWNLINLSMHFSSKFSFVNLNSDRNGRSELIDEAYLSWINVFKPGLLYLLDKVSKGWEEK